MREQERPELHDTRLFNFRLVKIVQMKAIRQLAFFPESNSNANKQHNRQQTNIAFSLLHTTSKSKQAPARSIFVGN
ncbi:hypothetical protein T11_18499 [Trichinella zimbabwensis]|uniref:Uncharacterized protein n=1 Tax=Trichinella zimbabwensis TaxID=268475 RepID=A0A0V1IA44_9BILA|nr:hypothetical protein T11_18499 [Trichinella zimbabwensis]